MDYNEFRSSLKTGKRTRWSAETFATYVHLRYPHIHFAPGQEWNGVTAKYRFLCTLHGEYLAAANDIIKEHTGCHCRDCYALQTRATVGKKRVKRSTQQERDLARSLYYELGNLHEVARMLNRSPSAILKWVNPAFAEKTRNSEYERSHRPEVLARRLVTSQIYAETPHRKASRRRSNGHT
jgi:hypothetical protein